MELQVRFQQPLFSADLPPPLHESAVAGRFMAGMFQTSPANTGSDLAWPQPAQNRLSAAAAPFVPLCHQTFSPPPFWPQPPAPAPLSEQSPLAALPSFMHTSLGKSLGLISCGDYGQW